jgi:hypothetical protein
MKKPRRCRAGHVQTIMTPLKVGNTDDRFPLGTKEKPRTRRGQSYSYEDGTPFGERCPAQKLWRAFGLVHDLEALWRAAFSVWLSRTPCISTQGIACARNRRKARHLGAGRPVGSVYK